MHVMIQSVFGVVLLSTRPVGTGVRNAIKVNLHLPPQPEFVLVFHSTFAATPPLIHLLNQHLDPCFEGWIFSLVRDYNICLWILISSTFSPLDFLGDGSNGLLVPGGVEWMGVW